jgi:hypothetical protein
MSSDVPHIFISSTGSILGATMGAIVYSVISTTGDAVASATSTTIDVGGELIAKGAEYIAGPSVGNTIRVAKSAAGLMSKPIIKTYSKSGAVGLSILAGTLGAITTSAIIYGGKMLTNTIYSYTNKCVKLYNETAMNNIQYPIDISDTSDYVSDMSGNISYNGIIDLDDKIILCECIECQSTFSSMSSDRAREKIEIAGLDGKEGGEGEGEVADEVAGEVGEEEVTLTQETS